MADRIELSREVLGELLTVIACRVGNDWNVNVFGGCAPHVGSVSLAEYVGDTVLLRTLERDAHKDQIVGDRYAKRISRQEKCTVAVSCGIHFHNPSLEDLGEIVSCADKLLEDLCNKIGQI